MDSFGFVGIFVDVGVLGVVAALETVVVEIPRRGRHFAASDEKFKKA